LSYGETLSREIAGVTARTGLPIIRTSAGCSTGGPTVQNGGRMDLAMAMGVALLGMFAGSTIYFFYKVER
jgi:hypothetical protein